jgi:Asp/Glu/hydantoin racemase
MSKKVVIVHTGPVTVQPLARVGGETLADVEVVNIIDDSLLKDVMKAGGLTDAVRQRMADYFKIAEGMGADAILNACSSVGEAAEEAAASLNIPVVKIDNWMAERAVEIGKKIGVAATVQTTLEPTVRLIERKASERGKEIQVERALCSEAFTALLAGEGEKHDELLITAVRDLAERNDVVVLAQVSMARLTERLADLPKPVLSSPALGIGELAERLNTL